MKLYIIASLIILFGLNSVYGQPEKSIDSLKNLLNSAKDDTNKYNILTDLSGEYEFMGNHSQTMLYLNMALTLSEKIGFKKGTGKALSNIGVTFYQQDNYPEALKYHKKALKVREEIGDKNGVADTYNNIGIIYMQQGDYSNALKYYVLALAINTEKENKKLMAYNYHNIGSVYFLQGNYEEALRNNLSSLKIKEELKDMKGVASSYHNIGLIYDYQESYDEALKNYLKAIEKKKEIGDRKGLASTLGCVGNIYIVKGNYSEALKSHSEALKLNEEFGDKNGISNAYCNMGIIYEKQGMLNNAMNFYLASLNMSKEIGDQYGIADSYKNIGALNTVSKKYPEARDYLLKAVDLSKKVGALELIKDSYVALYKLDSAENKFSQAFQHFKLYTSYKDNILDEERGNQIAQLKAQYESERKDKEIEGLNKDKKIQLVEINKQKIIRNATLSIVGVVGLFSFLLVYSYNKRRKSSFEKQVSEVEMKALRAQMNPHFIFNSLQSVKKFILENNRNVAADYLSKFSRLMRLILENSRKHEVTLDKDLSALELYMELESLRFQNRFRYEIIIDPGLDKEDTLIPPLLLQPFVENSIIHGVSSKDNGLIVVRIAKENDSIRCTVEDNGIGRNQSVQVEPGEKKKRESLGMKITQERLNIINQLKKVKAAVNIFDLKDEENNPNGLKVELLLPFETAF